jgi:hypothetical protein
MLNAVEKMKRDGKIRFLAVSSHGPNQMEDLMMSAVKSGHYDIIMPSHNFMEFPNVPAVIREAGKRGVGVVAMKSLAGAKDMRIETRGDDFEHAAFKWVLRNPNVAGLVITIKNRRQLEHFVKASGQPFTAETQRTLDLYKLAYSKEYCRTGCGECLGSCSDNVSVPTVLRYEMYFTDYGEQKRAISEYGRLANKADKCLACKTPSCEAACPFGLPVSTMMKKAHENLTLLS